MSCRMFFPFPFPFPFLFAARVAPASVGVGVPAAGGWEGAQLPNYFVAFSFVVEVFSGCLRVLLDS